MSADSIQHCSCDYQWTGFSWSLTRLNHVLLTHFASFSVAALLVNGGIVITNKANSSPSHINATRGSSVWLHWNYTYIGDGRHGRTVHFVSKYRDQIIGFSSASQHLTQVIAKRSGQGGDLTLELSVPVQLHGRLEAIASNSTLVIHDLQYNDSSYYFSSDVNVNIDIGADHVLHDFHLQPIVSLTVFGVPEFIKEPSYEVEVNENSPLELRIEIAGNPKPKAYFKWNHFSNVSQVNVSSAPLDQSLYYAIYKMNNVDASYCGRQLQATLRNSFGDSSTKHIRVFVLLNFDKPLNLQAKRVPQSGCIKVTWKRVEGATCDIEYLVALKDAGGKEVNKTMERNVGETSICSVLRKFLITQVQLTVKFRKRSRTVTTVISEGGRSQRDKFCSRQPTEKSTPHQFTVDPLTPTVFSESSKTTSSLGLTGIVIIVIGSLLLSTLIGYLALRGVKVVKARDKHLRDIRTNNNAETNCMTLLPRIAQEGSAYEKLDEYGERCI